jgi:hypothetical protein
MPPAADYGEQPEQPECRWHRVHVTDAEIAGRIAADEAPADEAPADIPNASVVLSQDSVSVSIVVGTTCCMTSITSGRPSWAGCTGTGACVDLITSQDYLTRGQRRHAGKLRDAGLDAGDSAEVLAERAGLSVAEVYATQAGIYRRPVAHLVPALVCGPRAGGHRGEARPEGRRRPMAAGEDAVVAVHRSMCRAALAT